MKHKEAVSRLINSVRLLNKDEHISRRYVLKLLKDASRTLISQKILDRTIQKDLNLFTRIDCIEFDKEDVVRCPLIEFRRCGVLMKSKKPIPTPIFSRIGNSLYNIESIDSSKEFKQVTRAQYRTDKDRRYSDDKVKVYLGEDMHLYIPDHEIYSVNIGMITLDTEDADECSSCSDGDCKSAWDYEFIVPDKLVSAVFDIAKQELAGLYKQIVPDQNPNNVERQ